MKNTKDSKQMLFEMMQKVNPDFKIKINEIANPSEIEDAKSLVKSLFPNHYRKDINKIVIDNYYSNEEGTISFDFQILFNKTTDFNPEITDGPITLDKILDYMNTNYSSGPGQSYSKSYITGNKETENQIWVSGNYRGGYDI